MSDLIDIDKFPVKEVLKQLLQDKTTGRNIIFATDMYSDYGYTELTPMSATAIMGFDSCEIQPRVRKAQSEQDLRTRKKAEVFTPTWLCNMMNNYCDIEWFGREDVFNRMDSEHHHYPNNDRIIFPKGKTWQKYVDSRRLEITCGEAPYLVSRYDTTTGEVIPIHERIGLLDRKLRVVGENTETEEEWLKWAVRAYQSIYGYEFQGDNLLIARINLLITFCDYLKERWKRDATKAEVKKIANIISWNLWQMDGLSDTVPVGIPEGSCQQMTLFGGDEQEPPSVDCKIQDWRDKSPKIFKKIKDKNKRGVNMKFDFVIGNPPYQDNTLGENETFAPPIYNAFMDASYEVADKVELIHPARFLFNAGSTPKAWNQKMLKDEHFKVLYYEQDSSKVFSNTDIKGGVAVTYRDSTQVFGAIEMFTHFQELNSIMKKVKNHRTFKTLSNIVITRTAYRLTDKMHEDYPEAEKQLSKGHRYDMSTNIFDRLSQIFFDEKPDDGFEYIRILGRENNNRVYKYIRRDYVNKVCNLDKYKVILPKSNGSGAIGEVLSTPLVGTPLVGTTESFISIGIFDTLIEAENAFKYIKGKFSRVMLGVLKITQDNPPDRWYYVPLQNFTPDSDIDWSKSIPEIDQQLYKKYGLSQEEIDFIESHVKEMN